MTTGLAQAQSLPGALAAPHPAAPASAVSHAVDSAKTVAPAQPTHDAGSQATHSAPPPQPVPQAATNAAAQAASNSATQAGQSAKPAVATTTQHAAPHAQQVVSVAQQAAPVAQTVAPFAQHAAAGSSQLVSGAQRMTSGAQPVTSAAQPVTSDAQQATSGAEQVVSGAQSVTSGGESVGAGVAASDSHDSDSTGSAANGDDGATAQQIVTQVAAGMADLEETVLPVVDQAAQVGEPLAQPIEAVAQPVVQLVDNLANAAMADAPTLPNGMRGGGHHATPATNVDQPADAPAELALDAGQAAADTPNAAIDSAEEASDADAAQAEPNAAAGVEARNTDGAADARDADVAAEARGTGGAADSGDPTSALQITRADSVDSLVAPAAPYGQVIAQPAALPASDADAQAASLASALQEPIDDPLADWAELPPSRAIATGHAAVQTTRAPNSTQLQQEQNPLARLNALNQLEFVGLGPRLELPSGTPVSNAPSPTTPQVPSEAPGGAAPPPATAAGGLLLASAGPPGTAVPLVAGVLLAATWRALWLVARLRPVGISLPNLAPPG